MNPKSERKRTCEHAVGTQKTLVQRRNRCTWGKKERKIPHSESEMIFKVDSWIGEAVEREKTVDKVSLSHDKAGQMAKIGGISRREVLNIHEEVSADLKGTADQEKKKRKSLEGEKFSLIVLIKLLCLV